MGAKVTGLERVKRAHKVLIFRLAHATEPYTGGAFRALLDAIERAADRDPPAEWWDAAPDALGLVWLAELALSQSPAAWRAPLRGRCDCGNGTYEVLSAAVRCTHCMVTYEGPNLPEGRP